MAYLILRIASLLRASGIFVGPDELRDCLALLEVHKDDPLGKYAVYELINTTMVKVSWGADYVMWLVELYFGPDLERACDRFGRLANSPAPEPSGEDGEASGPPPTDQLLEAVLTGDFKRIFATFKGLNLGLEPDIEDRDLALERFRKACGWLEVSYLIDQGLAAGELSRDACDSARKHLRDWDLLIQTEVDLALSRNMAAPVLLAELTRRNPQTESFVDCREDLMEAVRSEVKKLGRKLATRKGRRLTPGPSGPISLARTIKKSIRTKGVPMDLVRMKRKRSKPDLWLICDVSNSGRQFIYFLMTLVYATQKSFADIRSFLFVDELAEATGYFKDSDWETVLFNLKTLKGFNSTGFSDYGRVFRQFADTYLEHLTKRTTVLILGDGKNNGHNDTGITVLPRIRERAAALYWLSPFGRESWGEKDCLMDLYAPCCTAAWPCPNLKGLERFLAAI